MTLRADPRMPGHGTFTMKIVRLFLILVCICAPFLSTTAKAAETFTLEQAVERALKNNPSIEAKLLTLEHAKMNIGIAQSYFWPRVSLVVSANRIENYEEVQTYSSDDLTSKSWSRGVRLTMSLFAGFAHLNNLEKSRILAETESARHQYACLELMCNVQLQFLQLLKYREDLKSAQEAVERIEAQLKMAEDFVKVGMAPYVNVLQNKTELARAQQEVIRVKNNIRNSEVQLNRYLGFSPEIPVNYTGNLHDFYSTELFNEAESIETAIKKRPDLTVARKSVEAAYKDMHIRMGEFLPRVDANYDNMRFTKDYEDKRYNDYTRHYWAAGISMSWDLFTGGSSTFATLSERKRAQALGKEYENAVAGVRTDVIRAILDVQAAKELIASTRAGMEAARESYAMANKRYMTGIGAITELLDAQLRLTQAETAASQALMEFHGARAKFYFYIGRENPGLI